MRKILWVGAAAAALGGCIPVPYQYQVTTCRVEGFETLVGREANEATGAEALRLSGAKKLRWVRPDMMVTQEYDPERVTIWVGADNKVQRANCG